MPNGYQMSTMLKAAEQQPLQSKNEKGLTLKKQKHKQKNVWYYS